MGAITITKSQFESLIKSVAVQTGAEWEYADEEGVGEYVYYLRTASMPDSLVVRVCSTINTYNDKSRGDGDDSIKTHLFHTEVERPVAGRTYTKRIDTWEENLRPKILDCLTDWQSMITYCPDCSVPMVIQSSSYGSFLGCPNYPDCEQKKDL